jgi:hypothetical protein
MWVAEAPLGWSLNSSTAMGRTAEIPPGLAVSISQQAHLSSGRDPLPMDAHHANRPVHGRGTEIEGWDRLLDGLTPPRSARKCQSSGLGSTYPHIPISSLSTTKIYY